MNKEEFAISEKIYENYDGLKIKIVFSNLGRKYKKNRRSIIFNARKRRIKIRR